MFLYYTLESHATFHVAKLLCFPQNRVRLQRSLLYILTNALPPLDHSSIIGVYYHALEFILFSISLIKFQTIPCYGLDFDSYTSILLFVLYLTPILQVLEHSQQMIPPIVGSLILPTFFSYKQDQNFQNEICPFTRQ